MSAVFHGKDPKQRCFEGPRAGRFRIRNCGACVVALLAKGTTLGFVRQEDFPLKGDRDLRGVTRLAVIRIWRQRA